MYPGSNVIGGGLAVGGGGLAATGPPAPWAVIGGLTLLLVGLALLRLFPKRNKFKA
jgi:hypothetical protein